MNLKFLPFCFAIFLSFNGTSQISINILSGKILDDANEPIPFALVHLDQKISTSSDINGEYKFKSIKSGTHKIQVQALGYQTISRNISFTQTSTLNITLYPLEIDLGEVIVKGKSNRKKIEEQAFEVNSISIQQFQNSSTDIGQILSRSTGINVRENGGLGSNFNFTLNGLSGKQVKIFINGILMDRMGTSLSINNLPSEMIDRIDIYKGVVPIFLGADALGGAINIISKQTTKNHLDASYSVGSFNTHRINVIAEHISDSSGFVIGTQFIHNYSDNNYSIEASIPDQLSGKFLEPKNFERFHDSYLSQTGQFHFGWKNRSFAEELIMNITASHNKKDIQHSNTINHVFGKAYSTDQILMPSIQFKKNNFIIEKLNLGAFVSFIERESKLIDTSSRTHYWDGSYSINTNTNIGEIAWTKSLFQFNDQSFTSNLNLSYPIGKSHLLSGNYSYNQLKRVGKDEAKSTLTSFSSPNTISKQIFAFSYQFSTNNKRFSSTLFSKFYRMNAHLVAKNSYAENDFKKLDKMQSTEGYGFASTYKVNGSLQLKASFEKAFRIPEGYELFGDGILLKSNPSLLPERSHNINLGGIFHLEEEHFQLKLSGNLFYRNTQDMIRSESSGIYSQYVNQRDVKTTGIEGGASLSFHKFTFSINTTYQNIINTSQFEKNLPSPIYLDRIPNVPYLFANSNLGIKFKNVIIGSDQISFNLSSRFVEKYYLFWPSQGDPTLKHIIPSQLTHGIETIYSALNGKYNLSIESRNIFNAKVYDHFKIQKPGRAFYLKLRVHFSNN